MSEKSKGSQTNVDINLDQDFDIDYTNNRSKVDNEYESTSTNTTNHNVNLSTEHEVTYTKGHKLALELETEHTKTENYNKNVDVEVDESYTSDTFVLDVKKYVTENINVTQNLTENWNVNVNVNADNIIQNSDVYSDEDVNDIDTNHLINVSGGGKVSMDDFSLDITSIGDSFNGTGNDGHMNVSQSNNLVDNDVVYDTKAEYNNNQAPNVDASLDASASIYASEHAHFAADYKSVEYVEEKGDWKGYTKDSVTYTQGWLHGWYGASAAASASLGIDVALSAPTTAFETVVAEGGTAHAGDGIGTAELWDTNNDNEGDGAVSGAASASADANASAASFNNDIMAGGNQQLNIASVNLVGGDKLDAGDVKGITQDGDGSYSEAAGDGGLAIKDAWVSLDDDVNDLDTNSLINVSDSGTLYMDDFDLDIDAIGNAFNGPGNDWAFDVNQSNDLVDNDSVSGTYASYHGEGWNAPFQSVSASGGYATSGNGIGSIFASNTANSNGGDGAILGSTAASADALASATAFSNSIVVGANIQGNSWSATVVGGDSAIVDDIGH